MLRLFLANRKNNCSLLLVITVIALLSCNRGEAPGSNEKPEDNRFTKVLLAQGFDEPMARSFTNDGRVLIVERKGALKAVDTKNQPGKNDRCYSSKYKIYEQRSCGKRSRKGLMGIVVHPDFAKNYWIYMYYADPNDTKNVQRTKRLHKR
jgi:cytochrome c